MIPNKFDDCIATPKENGYQLLHTAVIGPDRKVFEIQIRTFAMDEDAELGVCAHWRYKEGITDPGYKDAYMENIAWLRQLLAWHDEMGMVDGLAEQLRSESTTPDRVYVFTPEGHVVDMMKGATPLDFSYYVHTEVGNKCWGAKVNGKTALLNYPLQAGDRVEVLADNNSAPSRDWLKPGLGYANTPCAQARLIQWFKTQGHEQNVEYGQALLAEEFSRLAVVNPNFRELARKLGCKNEEALYAAVGVSAITVEEAINAAQELSQLLCLVDDPISVGELRSEAGTVNGAGRLSTRLAACCNPQSGDAIVGCVIDANQVLVHRLDCPEVRIHEQTRHENLIDVRWGDGPRTSVFVDIYILAYDRGGLLRDITTILANEKIEVMEVNARSDRHSGTARMQLQVAISSPRILSRVLAKISHLNNVIEARRAEAGRTDGAERPA